jgi:hypothetical protein
VAESTCWYLFYFIFFPGYTQFLNPLFSVRGFSVLGVWSESMFFLYRRSQNPWGFFSIGGVKFNIFLFVFYFPVDFLQAESVSSISVCVLFFYRNKKATTNNEGEGRGG